MGVFTGSIAQLLSGAKIDGTTVLAWAEALQAENGAWTTWNPVWSSSGTNPTIGNGSVTGLYGQNGNKFWGLITITIGSTTTAGTGNYQTTMPPGISLFSGNAWEPLGVLAFRDSSGTTTYGFDAFSISAFSIGAASNSTRWGASSPIAIGTGDTIIIAFQGNNA